MKVAQMLLCKFVIMQDSNINTAIDNRRVYHLVAYFFFLNVSCIFGAPSVEAGYLTCTNLECVCGIWVAHSENNLWCGIWTC